MVLQTEILSVPVRQRRLVGTSISLSPNSPSTLMTVPLSLAIELQVSPGAATTTSLQKAMVLPVQTALPA